MFDMETHQCLWMLVSFRFCNLIFVTQGIALPLPFPEQRLSLIGYLIIASKEIYSDSATSSSSDTFLANKYHKTQVELELTGFSPSYRVYLYSRGWYYLKLLGIG